MRPEGVNESLKSDLNKKNGEKRFRLHPTHLKRRVSKLRSSGRLPALGIPPQYSWNTYMEARRRKAQTHAHTRTRTKASKEEARRRHNTLRT